MRKIFSFIIILLSIILLSSCDSNKYQKALKYIESKNYESARDILLKLDGYRESNELLNNFYYVPATETSEVDYNAPSNNVSYQKPFTKNYYYDENNLLKEIKYFDSNSKESSYKNELYYVVDGYLSKEVHNDSLDTIIEYQYDEFGRLIEKIETTNIDLNYITKYLYDNDGRILKEYVDGKYNEQIIDYPIINYFYDEHLNLKKKEIIRNNSHSETFEYLYNEKSELIITIKTFNDTNHVIEYEYDQLGNLIKERYFVAGELYTFKDYTYDDLNRLTKINEKYASGYFLSSVEYEYENNSLTKSIYKNAYEGINIEYEWKLVYIEGNIPLHMEEIIVHYLSGVSMF